MYVCMYVCMYLRNLFQNITMIYKAFSHIVFNKRCHFYMFYALHTAFIDQYTDISMHRYSICSVDNSICILTIVHCDTSMYSIVPSLQGGRGGVIWQTGHLAEFNLKYEPVLLAEFKISKWKNGQIL